MTTKKAAKKNGRVPIYYRKGSWEVKKGQGRWKFKYTGDIPEEQVRRSLELEFPGYPISRWRKCFKKGK